MCHSPDLEGLVLVMIGERPAINYLQPQRIERIPEIAGIAQAAEGSNTPGSETGYDRSGTIITPVARDQLRAKHRSPWIVFGDSSADGFEPPVVFGTRNYEASRTRQRFERFAQPPERHELLPAKR